MDGIHTSSETEALNEILNWSKTKPIWIRDALRRIVTQEEISEEDIMELTSLCKNDPSITSDPMSNEHITHPQNIKSPVIVSKIKNLEGVNALAEKQSLNFVQNGITAVYGDNGAGKSGFVRVLKKTCRARKDKDERIVPDIRKQMPKLPSAEIYYKINDTEKKHIWSSQSNLDDDLGLVSIFDTKTANVHVEKTNNVAYIPYPMQALNTLVGLCDRIKNNVEFEIKELEATIPDVVKEPSCFSDSEVDKLVRKLSYKTPDQSITDLANLKPEDISRYNSLDKDFSQNPVQAAKILNKYADKLEGFLSKFEKITILSSDENISKLEKLRKDFETKKNASQISSQELSSISSLPQIGDDVWRQLWEAARKYSDGIAYKGQKFPNYEMDSKCVLCHQDMNDEVVQRLQKFEDFIHDTTKKAEEQAHSLLNEEREKSKKVLLTIKEINEVVSFISDEISNDSLSIKVKGFLLISLRKLTTYLRSNSQKEYSRNYLIPQKELQESINDFRNRARVLLSDRQSPEFKKIELEYHNLKDRLWLKEHEHKFVNHISTLNKLNKLKGAKRHTSSSSVTTKNNELSEKLVTNALRGQFSREINTLRLSKLNIELSKQKGRKGASFFRVALIDKPDQNVGEILSEGEYRCVALAAFLAELSTTENNSAILFDDPMSSLDHLHRRTVAQRLARESLKRQVIVFTHDLSFLFELEREAKGASTPIEIRHVLKKQNEPGHVEDSAPLKAQNTLKRIERHKSYLCSNKPVYEMDPQGQWLITSKGILDEIRQTWEQAVADVIKPVMSRLSNNISTKGLGKLTVITEDDVTKMRSSYRRISDLKHHASEELNFDIPTPEQIEKEIDEMEDWIISIQAKQGMVKTQETSYALNA